MTELFTLSDPIWIGDLNEECVQNECHEFTIDYMTSGGQSYFKKISIKASEKNRKSDTIIKKFAPMKRYNCKMADSVGLYKTKNKK